MQVAPKYQRDPSALALLHVQTPDRAQVPLSALVKTRQSVGPQSVNHSGQLPAVTVSFNLQPGAALGDAVARVKALADRTLPATISASFQGTAQAFQESMRGLGWVVVGGLLVHALRHARLLRLPGSPERVAGRTPRRRAGFLP